MGDVQSGHALDSLYVCISTHFGGGGLQVPWELGSLRYKIHNYVTKLGNQVPYRKFSANFPTLVRNFEAEMDRLRALSRPMLQNLWTDVTN